MHLEPSMLLYALCNLDQWCHHIKDKHLQSCQWSTGTLHLLLQQLSHCYVQFLTLYFIHHWK